jgi:hypothetical protein
MLDLDTNRHNNEATSNESWLQSYVYKCRESPPQNNYCTGSFDQLVVAVCESVERHPMERIDTLVTFPLMTYPSI